jgi:transposase
MDQTDFMNADRLRSAYTDAFKLAVIKDYFSSGLSKRALCRKYTIRSQGALNRWLQQFGYAVPKPESVNFENIIPANLSKKKPSKNDEPLSAQEQIRQLKRQLEDEQLRSEMYLRMIEIAETEYKIPVRKKPDTK